MTKDEERLAIEVEQWLPNEYETLVGVLNDRTTLRAVSKALSDQVHELRARLAERPQAPADPVAEQLARLLATHGPEAPTGGDFETWWAEHGDGTDGSDPNMHRTVIAAECAWDAAWEARGAEVRAAEAKAAREATKAEAAHREKHLAYERESATEARLAEAERISEQRHESAVRWMQEAGSEKRLREEVEAERDAQLEMAQQLARERVAEAAHRKRAEARAEQAEQRADSLQAGDHLHEVIGQERAAAAAEGYAKGRAEATEAAARVCEVKAEKHRRPRVNRAENDACAVALDVAASDIRASTHRKAPAPAKVWRCERGHAPSGKYAVSGSCGCEVCGASMMLIDPTHRKAPDDAALEADKVNPQWTGHGPTEWRWDGNAGTWVAAWAYGHLHVRRIGESDDLGIAVPDHIVDRCLQDRPTHRKGDAGPAADERAKGWREAMAVLRHSARARGDGVIWDVLEHVEAQYKVRCEPVPTEGPEKEQGQ